MKDNNDIIKTIHSMFGMVLFFVVINAIDQSNTIFSEEFTNKLKIILVSDKAFYYSIFLSMPCCISYLITHKTFFCTNNSVKEFTAILFEIVTGYFYSIYFMCSGVALFGSIVMFFGKFYVWSMLLSLYSFAFMWVAIKITSLKHKNKTINNQLILPR